MTWGILGALDQEVALVKEQMQLERTEKLYGSDCHIGTIDGQRVAVVCCGIGKVNAAACTTGMILKYGAEAIVNVGIAGAAGSGLRTLDVVLSDEVVFHDTDPELFSRYYPYASRFAADKGLLELSQKAIEDQGERSYAHYTGRIATGDVFVNDSAVKADIVKRVDPLCVEMEGAAIGQVASMHGVPFLVIRTMSDSADDDADETYDNFLEPAACNSARIVVDMIRLSRRQG